MTYHGRIVNGVVVLDQSVKLPDGTEVLVQTATKSEHVESDSSWADAILELAGTVTGLPSDFAQKHDHYLYGTSGK